MDAVVAGAGAAGLSAALALAGRGASVLLLEAHETFRGGCNTAMSTAMIPAAGTRWQTDAGVDDSPERFLGDVLEKTKGTAYRPLAEALTSVSAELVTWLADDWSIPLELVSDFVYPGHTVHRCHTISDRSGRSLLRLLLDRVSAAETIMLAVPQRLAAVELAEDGCVAAALIIGADGVEERVATRNVVLATNGFGANEELVRHHIPEIADGLYFGGDGSTGDALVIGRTVGADTGWLDAYQGHGSVAYPHGVLVTWAVVMHGGIIVNGQGARFDDETCGYSEYAAKVLAQPDSRAWIVFDRRIAELCAPFADYQDLMSTGAIGFAHGAAELAELTGCGPGLVDTIANAATAAEGGRDPFGRTLWEAPLEPPYAAVAITGALFHTQGGLLVDGRARVLRGGTPIDGLYAAGGAAAGISGHGASGYLAGNGLLAAFGLGYLAGKDAVIE